MTTYSAVVTTGIYCRPGCGAKPLARNTRTYELAAAAEAAGFRACLRCRPYRVAGPVAADAPELVCRAWQLIIDGVLDEGTEAALARRVGLSPRHLRRLFLRHLGASPDQLARSRRAHFARRLLDDTDLTVLDIAFASGFGSLRQFNRIMREVFRASPTDLRERRHRADRLAADGGLALRLPVLPGYDWDAVRDFLAARAVPGVEAVEGRTYRRTITVDGAPGLLEVSPGDAAGHLLLVAHLPYWEGLIHVVDQVGRLLGTETDHTAGVAALSADPVLGPVVRERPGLAVPGAWSALEVGVRELLGRGRDPEEAARWLKALVEALGTPVPGLPDGLTHAFPPPEALTRARLESLTVDPDGRLPAEDAEAIAALAEGAGTLGYGTSPDALAALPYLDEDLRQVLGLRLGQREAFPLADPSLRAALEELGAPSGGADSWTAGRWRPWRPLAATHLMAYGDRRRKAAFSLSAE
ncbi:helix-turn-helix domain-containing protein [Nonomuraea sp. SMC257]|uniref:Helix-turn-helix domain-containing protein n=1 Tax=Nonomuraea montanisoli TaxID=2741721 RepID=A0A7Y6M6L9_9ACTN|nr:AlkA N-terminal domain-containing protein [Nonomuraea montanisoli]NUW37053.1 helix-turn-helix domain-containing protein [Nonomuraea montanisoli]